jgi:hypothetical protein
MRRSIRLWIALGVALVASAGCTPAAYQPVGQPQTPAVATPDRAVAEPVLRPYPEDQGDTHGLSRDPDDCDRGCIGGNPD